MFRAALIPLRCPTCGANLQVAGQANQFTCEHCETAYLLDKPLDKFSTAEREQLLALTTYTHQLKQWHKAGLYEICVHEILEGQVKEQRVLWANVEYRNRTHETLSCRRGQWVLFDVENYAYDPVSASQYFEPFGRVSFGGDRMATPNMYVRGWIAFAVPMATVPHRLQFLTGYLTTKTIEFLLK